MSNFHYFSTNMWHLMEFYGYVYEFISSRDPSFLDQNYLQLEAPCFPKARPLYLTSFFKSLKKGILSIQTIISCNP